MKKVFVMMAVGLMCSACGTMAGSGNYNEGYVDYSSNGPILIDHGGPRRPPVYCGMDGVAFNNLAQLVKKSYPDRDRLSVALSAAKTNNMTSAQVLAIMQQFDFDDAKVGFAKTAFPLVCDVNNWFVVYSAVTFDSNKKVLEGLLDAH